MNVNYTMFIGFYHSNHKSKRIARAAEMNNSRDVLFGFIESILRIANYFTAEIALLYLDSSVIIVFSYSAYVRTAS